MITVHKIILSMHLKGKTLKICLNNGNKYLIASDDPVTATPDTVSWVNKLELKRVVKTSAIVSIVEIGL